MEMMALVMAASSPSWCRSMMKERSIFKPLTGGRFR